MDKELKESLEQMNEEKMASMTEEEFDAWVDSFAGKELTWEEYHKIFDLVGKFYDTVSNAQKAIEGIKWTKN